MNGWDSKPTGLKKLDCNDTVNMDFNLINYQSINLNRLENSLHYYYIMGPCQN